MMVLAGSGKEKPLCVSEAQMNQIKKLLYDVETYICTSTMIESPNY
jgi:hypothetical protein